jgi:hypothetical protein
VRKKKEKRKWCVIHDYDEIEYFEIRLRNEEIVQKYVHFTRKELILGSIFCDSFHENIGRKNRNSDI